MDAKGWSRCQEPRKLLNESKGRASERQLRLFSCGLARLRWHKMEPAARLMVLGVERWLDGDAGARKPARSLPRGGAERGGPGYLALACAFRDAFESASRALDSLRVAKATLL